MIFRFYDFELDTDRHQLRRGTEVVSIEPQVFALLSLLIDNRDRMVGKDELIDKIWQGRFVSDAAVASRIKSARQAIGDDGKSQRLIKTIHGQGVRFVGELEQPTSAIELVAPPRETPVLEAQSTRPSIAILRFGTIGVDERFSGLAQAIPHELISGLSRQRWLMVIARGSSFRFHSDTADLREIGTTLGASYCLTGSLELFGNDLAITAELSDTRDLRVVWSERFAGKLDELQELRARIIERIVGALEMQIAENEAQWARLSGMDNLDAWAAFHLGLQHMYRFNVKDNEIAEGLFERAIKLDPGLARAHAGLSFTRFQTVFMGRSVERGKDIVRSRAAAETAMGLDRLDPFANFNLGRSFWLEGELALGLGWLERATQLNPNYAQGLYARAWNEVIDGRTDEAERHTGLAMRLSPLDPLYYAFVAVNALSHLQRGEAPSAARWAERAASAPGAHVFIELIAAIGHQMAGDPARASDWVARLKRRRSDLSAGNFLASFPFTDLRFRADIGRTLNELGFD